MNLIFQKFFNPEILLSMLSNNTNRVPFVFLHDLTNFLFGHKEVTIPFSREPKEREANAQNWNW